MVRRALVLRVPPVAVPAGSVQQHRKIGRRNHASSNRGSSSQASRNQGSSLVALPTVAVQAPVGSRHLLLHVAAQHVAMPLVAVLLVRELRSLITTASRGQAVAVTLAVVVPRVQAPIVSRVVAVLAQVRAAAVPAPIGVVLRVRVTAVRIAAVQAIREAATTGLRRPITTRVEVVGLITTEILEAEAQIAEVQETVAPMAVVM